MIHVDSLNSIQSITPSLSQVQYIKVKNHSKNPVKNLEKIGCWKEFLEHHPNEPLYQEINQKVRRISFLISKSEKMVAVPNDSALQLLANRYQKKYEITICVIDHSKLSAFLETMLIGPPKYVGLIAGDYLAQETTHVIPLLFYFPGNNRKEEIECLDLDCVASVSYAYLLIQYGLSQEKIWSTLRVRQSDGFSCRTGAITLLRNALLSIKYHGYQNGFSKVLQEGQIREQFIEILPPEWDYTEQFTNTKLNDQHLAIASCFQKKHAVPEKALEHRTRYQRSLKFDYEILSNSSPPLFESSVPSGFQLICHNASFSFAFSMTRNVNCYLLKKGNSYSKKHK